METSAIQTNDRMLPTDHSAIDIYNIGVTVKEKPLFKEVPASQKCTAGCTSGTCSVGTCHNCHSDLIKV